MVLRAEKSQATCRYLSFVVRLKHHQKEYEQIMPDKPFTTFPILTTERLKLRPLLESDAKEIFLLRSDTAINKFLDRKPDESLEDALNFIRNIKKNEFLYWAITQTQNGKLVGTICLFSVSQELKKCEIGYELLTHYQGQGIMNEAIRIIIKFAADKLGLKIIDACTHKDNQSSLKLLKKLNFVETEIIDELNPNLIIFRFLTS